MGASSKNVGVFMHLQSLFIAVWRLFTIDQLLGYAIYKFAKLGLGQCTDFCVDRIAAFEHD